MNMDVTVPLHGKVALITGGTSGIGLETARVLARNGADIAINGFGSADEIEEIRTSIGATTGRRVEHFAHDLSDYGQASRLVADALAKCEAVDILVNCAGVQHVCDIERFSDDAWNRLIAVNLSAAFATIRSAWPGMKTRGWGRIINVASTLAMRAENQKSAYVASKHGILGLTREIALEGAPLGITCNAICPSWVLTPLVRQQVEAKAKELGLSFEETARTAFLRDLPTRRFVETAEVAATMLFLCSNAAKSVTGAAIPVDGASTVR
ncbi:SDR family oxidoreductase [Paraburkholderia sp. UYCP14C]|uniref:3-hydroxybutyrate dehydrogenase n=1 Tax=Paraburkholderia sp. UYCP14C TaxID=2511130 RepID=UPI00101F3A96|nr:3-hydroxybutyrate dehydrogenase [Paraburkholderia sp. UYCP14C]RZF23935.1 SDR family oxidoreductase [Paraburkholderia sp. UYCP14C]